MTIVTPSTFYRWVRDEGSDKPKVKNPKGGQRKPKEIRALVIQIAKTTGHGYSRIIGEMRKLGIKNISRQTVRNILKEEGIKQAPTAVPILGTTSSSGTPKHSGRSTSSR